MVQTEPLGGLAVAGEKGVTVAVDPHLTPALIREGYARDLVRGINDMRKKAGLDISDRIELGYEAEGEVAAAIKDFAAYIGEETLAVGLVSGGVKDPAYNQSIEVGDEQVRITLRKAN